MGNANVIAMSMALVSMELARKEGMDAAWELAATSAAKSAIEKAMIREGFSGVDTELVVSLMAQSMLQPFAVTAAVTRRR